MVVGAALILVACDDGFLDVTNQGEMVFPDAGPGEPDDAGGNGENGDAGNGDAGGNGGSGDAGQDIDEILPDCVDDQFAPANFTTQGAPELNAGDSFDLILCDNLNDDLTSHNWFHIGAPSGGFEIHLSWSGEPGLLRIDSYRVNADLVSQGFFADGSGGPHEETEIEFTNSSTIPDGQTIMVRVFFQSGMEKPVNGQAFTITRVQ